MLVTFKSITQEQFTEEFDENVTIADVKKKVEENKGENFAAANQKLIYNGKVLADDSILKDIGYDEKKFLVMIVKKAASAPPPAPEPEKPKEEEKPKKEETPATPAPAQVPETPVNRPPTNTPAAPRRQGVHPDHQSKLDDLIAMGYPEAEALAALRAAFFNSERAVEYLLTGIPDNVRSELDLEGGEEVADEEGLPTGLDFLMDNEQFTQLREIVRANPEALPQLIQQIAVDNPQLMQLIRENEQQFLDLLNSDAEEESSGNIAEAVGGQQQQEVPPNAIMISQADQEAINRLKDMGFPQDIVVEAYFACDKNEGLAVNYILSRMEEAYDEERQQQHQQ